MARCCEDRRLGAVLATASAENLRWLTARLQDPEIPVDHLLPALTCVPARNARDPCPQV